MKKNLLCGFVICALFASPSLIATENQESEIPKPSEETSFVMRLGVFTATSAFIHMAGGYAGASDVSKNMLHASNVMVQLGQIFDLPVAKRVGVNMLITAAASSVATTSHAKAYMRFIPLMGASLALAGEQGVAVVTGWLNDVFQYGYEVAVSQSGVARYLGL